MSAAQPKGPPPTGKMAELQSRASQLVRGAWRVAMLASVSLVLGCNLLFGIEQGKPRADGGAGGMGGSSGAGAMGGDCAAPACAMDGCEAIEWGGDPTRFSRGIALAGDRVFWSSFSREIHAASALGDTQPVSEASSVAIATPGRLVADESYVYFVGKGERDTVVGRLALGSQVVELVSRTPKGSGSGARLAVDAEHVYFGAHGMGLWRASKDDLSDVMQAQAVKVDVEAHGVAVDSTHVYWSELNSIKRLAIADVGQANPLVETLHDGGSNLITGVLLVHDAHVYWGDAGVVRRLPTSGGAAAQTLVADQGEVYDIAVDGTHVYWAAKYGTSGGRIGWTLKDGSGTPATIDHNREVQALALGCDALFWVDGDFDGGGRHTVWKLLK